MQTLNISLPQQLSCQIDRIVKQEGYASRSEFFRTILRLYLSLSGKNKLDSFQKQPINQIEKDLKKANYNDLFVESVIDGLRKSSPYADKTPSKRS